VPGDRSFTCGFRLSFVWSFSAFLVTSPPVRVVDSPQARSGRHPAQVRLLTLRYLRGVTIRSAA
jgi:hypothetical protein